MLPDVVRPPASIIVLAAAGVASCWLDQAPGPVSQPRPEAPARQTLVGSKPLNGPFPKAERCDVERKLGGSPFACGRVHEWTIAGGLKISVDTVNHYYHPYFIAIERGDEVWISDRLFVLVDDVNQRREPVVPSYRYTTRGTIADLVIHLAIPAQTRASLKGLIVEQEAYVERWRMRCDISGAPECVLDAPRPSQPRDPVP